MSPAVELSLCTAPIESETDDCTILVVDPDPDVPLAVSGAVPASYTVVFARNTDQAMAILQARPVGILLCNEDLPSQNGLAFMAGLKSAFPLLQPVLMSHAVDEDLLTYAINTVGVLKYLKKPLAPDQLQDAVGRAAAHYRQAQEIELLRSQHQRLTRQMQGFSYRRRRLRQIMRMIRSHSRVFFIASATSIIAISGLTLGLGVLVLGSLYTLKSLLGINIMASIHLEDLLF